MAKYRKKPVVIEAIQWFPDSGLHHPGVWCDHEGSDAGRPYVITIHNERAHLSPGDWIIPEPKDGHYYPCKPDIFEMTYEPAPEEISEERWENAVGEARYTLEEYKKIPAGAFGAIAIALTIARYENGERTEELFDELQAIE